MTQVDYQPLHSTGPTCTCSFRLILINYISLHQCYLSAVLSTSDCIYTLVYQSKTVFNTLFYVASSLRSRIYSFSELVFVVPLLLVNAVRKFDNIVSRTLFLISAFCCSPHVESLRVKETGKPLTLTAIFICLKMFLHM